jgi:hypothetical protein
MIDIHYTISKSEYIEAQRLFIKRRRRKSLYLRVALYAIFVVVCGIALVTSGNDMQGASIFIGTTAFIVIATVVISRALQKYLIGKRFATESKFLSGIHLTIDDDSFVVAPKA